MRIWAPNFNVINGDVLRMEKEKQAFWLEKAPEPTQDTDELLVAMEIPFDELEAQHDNLVSKVISN